jgi:hypothetical protein
MQDEATEISSWRWAAHKLFRHLQWVRAQGLRRVIEEDQLNPLVRTSLAAKKWRWRRAHSVAPMAIPVFVVGVQRSGTNMVVRGLEVAPEVEAHNENSRRAFDRFRLRPTPVIRELVEQSGHRYVLFKPLCDSHRTAGLLDYLGTPSPGRAIWVYRSVDGRVRSALAKFGDNNLGVLREIAAGRGLDRWQAQGLSHEKLQLIRGFDYDELTPESAAALFWYLRNGLYFDLGLNERDDVILMSYDALVADPEGAMGPLCKFLAFPFREDLVRHVEPREAPLRRPLVIDPLISRLCEDLHRRLDEEMEAQHPRAGAQPGGLATA